MPPSRAAFAFAFVLCAPSIGAAVTAAVSAAALVLPLALACASPSKTTWTEATPPEVLVELLPREALLALDGAPLGPGPRAVRIPEAARTYLLSATAPGFAPARRSEEGARLAGARVALVLRPDGFGEGRRLEYDDEAGLAAAAGFLGRAGRHAQAMQYAERAVELAPEVPLPRRVLGDAAWALGKTKRAIQEYSAYLAAAPAAPDRRAVERRLEELRGDITIPGAER